MAYCLNGCRPSSALEDRRWPGFSRTLKAGPICIILSVSRRGTQGRR